MPKVIDLKDEVSQLKSDADATRRPRRTRAAKRVKQEAPEHETNDLDTDYPLENSEIKVLIDKLTDLVEDAEHEIKERPVAMVLGAFALGIVVGSLMRR